MRRDLVTSAIAIVFFTVLLGLAYPLLVTGVSQVAFPGNSNGQQIKRNGKVVGSKLLGQSFKGPRWFHPRPSATDHDAAATAFSNRGPNQQSAKSFYGQQLAAYLALERRYDPSLTGRDVPVDAMTTSASGVDPDISQANARIQAHRIAAVRHLTLARVQRLIDANTDGRSLGVLGEPGVNVTTLNLALDQAR